MCELFVVLTVRSCQSKPDSLNIGKADAKPAQDCSIALASTPFCADASRDLWETSAGTNSYFCCCSGQIGLQSIEYVSGKQAVASSPSATSLGLVTSGAVYQTGAETKANGSVSGVYEHIQSDHDDRWGRIDREWNQEHCFGHNAQWR